VACNHHTSHILVSGSGYGLIYAAFLCQKLAARIVLDLRRYHVVTAQFYENGDTTDDGTSAGQI
jgi:hypothetical protein